MTQQSMLAGLNASQKKAVLHNTGPLLVLAGAGSGKTRVLTTRVARLVKEKVCGPGSILAVTFTNKAAREMRERLGKLLGAKTSEQMTVCTFHSFGARVLREHGDAVGIKRNYSILDEHERLASLKSLARFSTASKQPLDHLNIAGKISLLKNASVDPGECSDTDGIKLRKVYTDYQAELRKRQCVDFDDLLLLPLRLFEQHKDILTLYQKKYEFVCIDEYQDTNAVQIKLARLLAAPQNNIMVVGDDDQSIYAWRGANSENVLTFASAFKGCKTVLLDTNYRSTANILDAAMAVVAHNSKRTAKNVKAAAAEGEAVQHYRGEDEVDEAQWVARSIKTNVEQEKRRYGDHALLFRTNAMMRRFEEELRHAAVPYRVVGSMSFFDRREVKDLVAYMRFLANPDDELSMGRVLKVPDSGIGKATLGRLEELAARRRISLYRALEHFEDAGGIDGIAAEKCASLRDWARRHITLAAEGNPARAVREALDARGYRAALEAAVKDEEHGKDRLENVDEMLHGLDIYERRSKEASLAGYVQELSLQSTDEDRNDADKKSQGATLLTIHKAKGLEFPVVYMVGLDDSVFPSPRTIEEGNIDEERRLFYVGMTRAMKRLVLTWPQLKVWHAKDIPVKPTRFIYEIPEEFLDGPLGEQQAAKREETLNDFFQQMREKFGTTDEEQPAPPPPRRKLPLAGNTLMP